MKTDFDFRIRHLLPGEERLMKRFLYEAIFVPEGSEAPPAEIVDRPELQVYISDFGKYKDDHCLIAEAEGRAVGMIWCRIMNDYGYFNDETPSLAVSVLKEYRGFGIGTCLMKEMLSLLNTLGYPGASLSVQKENRAVSLYLKAGFHTVKETEEEYIMVCDLNRQKEKAHSEPD